MTGRSPDQLLLISSMDVDIAVKRVAVLRIEPLQPEDATQDEILVTAWGGNHSRGLSSLEAHPCGGISSELCVNPKAASWSSKAPFLSPQTILGGGDWIGKDGPIGLLEIQALSAHIQDKTYAICGWW